MPSNHLLLGTIDARGHISPTPIVVTLNDGHVTHWSPLTGHEPAATTPLRALLHLPTLTLRPLPDP